jgi:hypothetical protein
MGIARTWGSTPEDRARPYPCDDHAVDGEVLFRAVEVRAPAPVVFRWLCQLRIAPYSYDWLDKLRAHEPAEADPRDG